LYVVWLAAFWLSRALVIHNRIPLSIGVTMLSHRLAQVLLWSVLSVQAIGGMVALGDDLLYPFSNGATAARLIQERGLADEVLAGHPDAAVSTLAGALDRPFYYFERQEFGTFIIWDQKRLRPFDQQQVIGTCRALAEASGKSVVLVFRDP